MFICAWLSGTLKALQTASSLLWRCKHGQRTMLCWGKIIRVCSFSTHTYSNNQEHSVLPAQKNSHHILFGTWIFSSRSSLHFLEETEETVELHLLIEALPYLDTVRCAARKHKHLTVHWEFRKPSKIWRYLINTCNILYSIVYIHPFS